MGDANECLAQKASPSFPDAYLHNSPAKNDQAVPTLLRTESYSNNRACRKAIHINGACFSKARRMAFEHTPCMAVRTRASESREDQLASDERGVWLRAVHTGLPCLLTSILSKLNVMIMRYKGY